MNTHQSEQRKRRSGELAPRQHGPAASKRVRATSSGSCVDSKDTETANAAAHLQVHGRTCQNCAHITSKALPYCGGIVWKPGQVSVTVQGRCCATLSQWFTVQTDSGMVGRLLTIKQPGDSAEFQRVWVAGYDVESRYATGSFHTDSSMVGDSSL